MGILRVIAQTLVLAMFDMKAHLRPRSAIGSELVRDHHARPRDGGFQEFCREPLCRAGVSAVLGQDVENKAILIDSAPQPVLFARLRRR